MHLPTSPPLIERFSLPVCLLLLFFFMNFRKQSTPATPWIDKSEKYSKNKDMAAQLSVVKPFIKYTIVLSASLFAWYLVIFLWFTPSSFTIARKVPSPTNAVKQICDQSVYFYVYDLPPEFNVDLVNDCRHLNVYTDMCPHVANRGLGQKISGEGVLASAPGSWFATHQFIAEMIFHARVENHPCRTDDPSLADLFYVPFYGGLHASSKFRETNVSERDFLAVQLLEFLQRQQTWLNHNGKDHFMALGRTAWDFMRNSLGGPDFGANCLLDLPAVQNLSVLTVERHPWRGKNQYGIPYPSYFHPSTSSEMLTWQSEMRRSKRPHLFSFAGAPRKGLEKAAIRDEIISQCRKSDGCVLVDCSGQGRSNCYEPGHVMSVMSRSEFCLQAPGDSFTRRSTFDSVLAGCIPVFFSQHTAYSQYSWFLPEEAATYSVFIDEKGNGSRRIEEELLKIPRERVEEMRERVISLIPRLTYMHPNASDYGFKDAVDTAIDALSKHVKLTLGRAN